MQARRSRMLTAAIDCRELQEQKLNYLARAGGWLCLRLNFRCSCVVARLVEGEKVGINMCTS
jgi:hypothetical protein